MARYAVDTQAQDGETLYVLTDTETGAWARVWPGFGNNCLGAQVPGRRSALVDLLHDTGDLAKVREQPSWYGMPLLFPWTSDISGLRYTFRGRSYELDSPGVVTRHGFVKTLAWHVAKTQAGDQAAEMVCAISSDDYPETLNGYPFPYRLETVHRLSGRGLDLQVTVRNVGDGELPFGFGAHPYFKLPLGDEGDADACIAHVPASSRWQAPRDYLKGGEPLSRERLVIPVPDDLDLRHGRPLGARQYDGVYTDLTLRNGLVECWVRDPASGLEAVMQASSNFPNIVMYRPPDRPSLCFEPWTCPPNVFNLAAAEVEGNCLIVLAPGETWRGDVRLFVRDSESPR
jgi:aldose 1-epimerase